MTRAEQRGRRPRVTQIEGGAGTSWTTGKLDGAFRERLLPRLTALFEEHKAAGLGGVAKQESFVEH